MHLPIAIKLDSDKIYIWPSLSIHLTATQILSLFIHHGKRTHTFEIRPRTLSTVPMAVVKKLLLKLSLFVFKRWIGTLLVLNLHMFIKRNWLCFLSNSTLVALTSLFYHLLSGNNSTLILNYRSIYLHPSSIFDRNFKEWTTSYQFINIFMGCRFKYFERLISHEIWPL